MWMIFLACSAPCKLLFSKIIDQESEKRKENRCKGPTNFGRIRSWHGGENR